MRQTILMVHNFYQIGGGEHTVFQQEVKLLRDHGHKVVLYTRHNDELNKSFIKKALLPFTTLFSLKTYRDIRRIIREEKIDIVHCHNTFPLISPSVYYAARREGRPAVQTIHNFRFLCPNALCFREGTICEDCLGGSFRPALRHGCYRQSKLQTAVVVSMLKLHRLLGTYRKISMIFLTDFNRNKFLSLIPKEAPHVYIKPNFEDLPLSPAPLSDIQRNKMVYIGRLDENKGLRHLLECWEEVPAEYHLHIYGAGPLEALIKEKMKKQPNIYWMGFQPQQEVWEDWRTACAMIFPSICYEGFPMTLIESLALGVPVLTCDIGNQAAVIEEGRTGYHYAPGDREGFRNQLERIRDHQAALKRHCREEYEERYTPDKNYEMLNSIYRRLGNVDS